jgi:hypothetical protein
MFRVRALDLPMTSVPYCDDDNVTTGASIITGIDASGITGG